MGEIGIGQVQRKGALLALIWGGSGYSEGILAEASEKQRIVALFPAVVSTINFREDDVHILGILSDDPGEEQLRIHSLPGLNSVRTLSPSLRLLFPGIREIQRISVPRVHSDKLLPWLEKADDITLLLDTPGSEGRMLAILEQAGLLGRISQIRLRCLTESGFEGGVSETDITRWLADRQFDRVNRLTADPDRPELHFIADVSAKRTRELEKKLACVGETLTARDAALAESNARAEQLAEALARRDADIAAIRAVLATREATLAESIAKAEELAETIVQREKSLKMEKERSDAHHKVALRHRDTLHAAQEVLARQLADLTQARNDLSITLENLQSTRADLSDLRHRHVQLHDEKSKLEDLIRKLTPRLQEAAGQLRNVSMFQTETAATQNVEGPVFQPAKRPARRSK